ncbi:MAG: FAD-binding oxidoreductase [Firmicutes bacterium]|nr:FAD-binding oxidoreductase [Bacillota bacterium]
MQTTDVLIIGAGVVGLSIAYHLAESYPGLDITVVEREKFPGMGATAHCTGGIRHQFSSRVNVEMTKISLPYFRRFNAEMGYPIYFRQYGYLFVTAKKERFGEFNKMVELLQSLDIPVSLYFAEDIGAKFPYLNVGDILGGTLCSLDGYADPHGVTQGYFKQAVKRGVKILTEEKVLSINAVKGRVAAVRTDTREIACGAVVNAAGPYLAEVAAMLGIGLPARPYRRQVYVCGAVPEISPGIPLTVDMDTGLYLHAEKSGTLLAGGTDKDTAPGYDQAVDKSLLDGFIEKAVHRIPAMIDARLLRAYVGIRCLTPDYHAILGETGAVRGFFCAGGFSGHGFMHAPATGLIMSQLIVDGRTNLVDLSPLSPDRFSTGYTAESNVF